MIYEIVVFDLRKGSGIHRKGFLMFPERFGHENTLSGPKGKPTRLLESAKGSFVEYRGQTPGSLAFGSRRREPWRLALESKKDSCLSGETDFVEAFTPSFDPKAQHINRGAGLAPKTDQETQVDPRDRSLAVCGAPCHLIPPRSYRCSA